MGCGPQSTALANQPAKNGDNKPAQKSRTDRKFQRINERFVCSDNQKLQQNVTLAQGQTISFVSSARIHDVLKNHFFFSGMTALERTQITNKMMVCRAESGKYVFNQGDLATAFFIISQGKVQVEINGEKKKTLQKNDYFGELALIYSAPRSAGIKVLENATFWCISRLVFRQTLEDYVKKNYSLAKTHINKLPLFSFLTEKQKDSISYNMISLKYEDQDVIFKENDDANSFFVIVKGKVQITIPGKPKLTLGVGESFGQQSFVENQVRTGNACAKGTTHCLSIGRDVVKNILGDRISNITNYNITKWALKRSKVLSKLSNIELEKLLETSEIKDYEDGDKVFKKGEIPKYLAVSLEGFLDDKPQGILVGEDMLGFKKDQKIPKDYLKKGRGYVSIITFQSITKCTGKKFQDILSGNSSSDYQKQMQLGTRKVLDYSHIKLQNLIHVKKLGQGQFGRVYLVKQNKSSNKMYALKCIRKDQVIESKMQKIILEQKRILEIINFPLMLTFMRSFKDSYNIYLLTEYIKGSELFDVIREIGILSKAIGRFYISSLILSLEYLHMKNIIYRDLKPENVMVENDGYLKLIDMGTAKQLTQDKGFRTFTIIGTPHYMAPEVMKGKGYSFAVDIWSIGILLYEFMCGQLPFAENAEDPYEIHSIIMKQTVKYPSFFSDPKAKKLIDQLLNKIPDSRLPKGFPSLKANQYFDGLNWEDLYCRKMKAPYLPKKPRISGDKIGGQGGLMLSVLAAEQQKEKTQIRQSDIKGWDQDF